MSPRSQKQLNVPLEGVSRALHELSVKRVLVVCGPSRRFVERLTAVLDAVDYRIFAGAQRHVPRTVVDKAAELLVSTKADCIVTLGGGSATGLGKALRLEHDVKFIAVPTTYSGSEFTTLFGVTRDGHKQTGRDARVLPDVVVCDPSLTVDMPLGLSAASMLNAMAHPLARLAQLEPSSAEHSECQRAVAVTLEALEALLVAPRSLASRVRAAGAARHAAMSIEAGTLGAHHQLVHSIGGSLDVEHSALHSVLLPHSVSRWRQHAPLAVQQLSLALDVPDLEALLFDYLVRAGTHRSLQEIGLTLEQLAPILDEQDSASRQVVLDAWHGQRPSCAVRRQDLGLPELVLLQGPPLETAERVVLCIHGRGSNAGAMLNRAQQIIGDAGGVTLVAPQARNNSWYEKRYNQSRAELGSELRDALEGLKRVAESLLRVVPPNRLALFGFSQGACLALELFIELETKLAAVVALSGARIGSPDEGKPPSAALRGTPVLLGKSDGDPFLDGEGGARAARELSEAGCEVTLKLVPGTAHGFHAEHRLLARPLLSGLRQREMPGGFGGFHSSEDLPGALPGSQNSPSPAPYGLVAEQVNATGFCVERALNQRSWLYRVRPSAQQRCLELLPHQTLVSDFEGRLPEPNLAALDPLPIPTGDAIDFVDGLVTIAGAGSARTRRGFAIHCYAANRNMEDRAFASCDGSLLVVPETGKLTLLTELGVLPIAPGSVAVLPKGLRFSVLLSDGQARGYLAEVFGHGFRLPERGPIGANGLSDARHFRAPVAWHEDRLAQGFELVIKSGGSVYTSTQDYSPFDVVAWHGNYAPYVYDLDLFAPVANARFDHVDPSVHTVLSAPLDEPGTNNLDFVVFVPRWDVSEHTFRPPYFHRNATTELNGIIRHHGRGPFRSGMTFLTPSLLSHGIIADRQPPSMPERPEAPQAPNRGELWFQFETTLPVALTGWAQNQLREGWRGVWGGYRSRFRTDR